MFLMIVRFETLFHFSLLLEPLHWKKLADVNIGRWVVFDGQLVNKNAGKFIKM